MDRVVIVGAGQAGAALAARLRAQGFGGDLTLVGAEPEAPYQRPPLSKKYLTGELPRERLMLRGPGFWAEQGIALLTGTAVAGIDRAARQVVLADGRSLPYDALALTTGSAPRLLPEGVGGGLRGVLPMRSLADADALAEVAKPGARALIVGGGYIGLEAAAVLRGLGLEVVLVEAAPRVLGRVAAPETAAWFRDLHRARGVDLREGTGLRNLTGTGGRVTGAELADGSRVAADFVVLGIGIRPETALAEAAGLAVSDGIEVDDRGVTSDPAIRAAGDCARLPWRGRRIRLESVQNAIDQAEAAADAMLGGGAPYDPVPWFWSDQYEVKLQIAGLSSGWERVVTRPGAKPGTHSVWYFAEGRLIAVDAMNEPRSYMLGKRWIEAGHSPDPVALADPAQDLKALG